MPQKVSAAHSAELGEMSSSTRQKEKEKKKKTGYVSS
jgi:hypothetical protein